MLVADAEGYRLDGPLTPLAIPATLQDSLMARLDRLVSVREIAQIGAAVGREFSYALMHALVARDEPALQQALTNSSRQSLCSAVASPRRRLQLQTRSGTGRGL
jgi:predicted ATPase